MQHEVDISGLPIYYVNKILSERLDDGSVMVICGFKRGNHFTPLYASISTSSVAIEDGKTYIEVAEMAGETSH